MKRRRISNSKGNSPAWDFDWTSVGWVHLMTRTKSRPEYIGYVDEDEGPHVYLIRPQILNKNGKWVDSWTWREEIGPLPGLPNSPSYFGEVIVYKWDITKIREIDFPGEINRCWYCGKRISRGRFCEPRHEFVFRGMGLDWEMLDENRVGPIPWTSEDMPLELERQYDFDNITADIEKVKALTEKEFSSKIKIITELIRLETKLSGIYTQQVLTKERIGAELVVNLILNNTVGNQPYRSISAFLLIRNSLYGSARPIIRQFFESLVFAKYAEVDPRLARRWRLQDESSRPSEQVSLSGDVLNVLEKRGIRVEALKRTWRDLCAMSHATRESQQVLRAPDPLKPDQFEEYLRISNYRANTEYSLDLLFMMLAMNFHLIDSHLAKKADRWWFGQLEDPYGSYKRVKKLRDEIVSSTKAYLKESSRFPSATELLQQNIREYESVWR